MQLVLSSSEHHSGRAQRAPLENTGEVEAEPTLFVVPGSFPTKAGVDEQAIDHRASRA